MISDTNPLQHTLPHPLEFVLVVAEHPPDRHDSKFLAMFLPYPLYNVTFLQYLSNWFLSVCLDYLLYVMVVKANVKWMYQVESARKN